VKGEAYQTTATLFQVLSHEVRLHILDELRNAEACVCHLQTVLGRPQAYVSQQLRVLRESGLVEDRRKGTLVFYRVANSQVEHLLNDMFGPAQEPVCLDNCPCPQCRR